MKNTEDFFNKLSNAHSEGSLDRIISDPGVSKESFDTYYCKVLDSRGVRKSELVNRVNISRTYIYQLLNGTRVPGRDNAIALCIAGGFSLNETDRCMALLKTGALYAKDARDAIIIYCINNKLSCSEANALLYKKDMKPLTE